MRRGARRVRGPVPRRPPRATTGVGLQIYTCARFGPDGLIAAGAGAADPGARHGAPSARRSAPRSPTPPRCCPDVPLLVTENGIATADDEDRIRFTERRPARPGGRDRRRRRRARLRALEPARQLRVDARLRAHLRPGRRSTGRPSPGRRSRASPGSARWPAATAWADPGKAPRGGPVRRPCRMDGFGNGTDDRSPKALRARFIAPYRSAHAGRSSRWIRRTWSGGRPRFPGAVRPPRAARPGATSTGPAP